MRSKASALSWFALVKLLLVVGSAAEVEPRWVLWYAEPATKWVEALPIGNGRLGAMVFGGIEEERIQFNEATVWTGKPHEYQHEGAVQYLPELRRLLQEGKPKEAEALATEHFMSVPLRQKSYQPFGDVRLRFEGQGKVSDYRRELDLDNGVCRVAYRVDQVRYEREMFSSYPDQVIVVRVAADKPGAVTFEVQLESPHAAGRVRRVAEDTLGLSGEVEPGGVRFEAWLRLKCQGGTVRATGTTIRVENADTAVLILAGASSFKNYRDISGDPSARCRATMQKSARKNFAELRRRHIEDHRALFRRVQLDGFIP